MNILHSIVSVLLVFAILVQHRASGLSATFGGSGGAEKVIYKASIWLSVAFFALSVLRWYIY